MLWRTLLFGLVLALGLALAQSGGQSGGQSGSFNWQKYDGTTIRVMLDSHPWQKYIQQHTSEFTKLTGIKVQLEVFPEDQYRQKRLLEVSAGSTSLDGYMFIPGQVQKLFNKEGWLAPVGQYLNDPSMTSSDFDFDDFFAGAVANYKKNGKLYGIPLHEESFILFYRKDLFNKYGITPPKTIQEWQDDAAKLKTDLAKDDSGMSVLAMRGKTPDATSSMVNFLYEYGGKWFENGKCALDSEASQKALTTYATMLQKYAPSGITNNSWQKNTELFAQGKVAMMYGSNVFKSIVDDPSSSTVAGKVGYAALPAGPAGAAPTAFGWGLGINAASQHKGAMWYFIQWALNKKNQLGYLLSGGPAARASAWNSPEFKNSSAYNQQWVEVSQQQLKIAKGFWDPPIIDVGAGRDAYGQAIVGAINGGNVTSLLKTACQKMEAAKAEFQ
jgi:multiple sugar transport system substrate-binding protein